MAETERSIGVVRNPRTVSAPAPKYTVVMTTEELSIFGYCCTGSVVSARQPISTMTRLTTMARTGCLMKMSVNDFRMAGISVSAGADALGLRGRWPGDRDEHGVAQLERARGGDPLSGGEPVDDHDLVAEHRAGAHEAKLGPCLPILPRGDDEHVVTTGSLAKRAHRNDHGIARRTDGDQHSHR